MKITHYSFEGTPQEFQAVQPLFQAEQGRDFNVSPESPASVAPAASADDLTEHIAEAFLTRRPLTRNQKAVIKYVMSAGDTGVTSSELAVLTGCEPGTIKSTMRSFGKRAAHTEGWPQGVEAFKRVWEGSQNRYRLHFVFRTVLKRLRLL